MEVHIHKSIHRGYTDNNWLKSWHSFSFADYFNPTREKFGVIRVVNQEVIAPGYGFEMHEYKNLEIILIPLRGGLKLRSADNVYQIQKENVVLISAGSGFSFSLLNESPDEEAHLLQIWIFPAKKNALPSIQMKTFNKTDTVVQNVISSVSESSAIDVLHIDQKIQLNFMKLSNGARSDYHILEKGNLVFAFVIEGKIKVNHESKEDQSQKIDPLVHQVRDNIAEQHDSIELSLIRKPFQFEALADCEILLIETQPD